MENFGKLLRRIREERGLTQGQLADLVGVDQAVISIHETGARNMKFSTLERLLAPLGMRPVITIVHDDGGGQQ